mmetsp:Transcript_13366/g.25378  ORF Transcript_13366/g.25378 Transcript_13366/m.25378 type:complete len:993 (-) Transcript_13366:75-3053(-)|eukprot:scaffold2510_cov169-Amphora_coffeaeformis.AAC.52
MPDCEDNQSVVSTKEAETELRTTFSDMLGGDGMDSFMNSVGNFMTDEEFFETGDLDVFKEIFDEYQKTPASKKKESADKLFESFSELFTLKQSPDKEKRKTPKKTPKKVNKRLADMRKEQNLDEVDDEESKMTSNTSPASSAQHSTVSDASLIQRGVKLENLGANPLGVSVNTDVLFTDTEDGPDHQLLAQSGRKKANENAILQRRATGLNEESRSSMNYNPEETPRQTRSRRDPLSRSHSCDGESFVRSSKIIMTPMKESGQRARSRGRATTPSQTRGASLSPSRSPGTALDSPRKSTHSRNMERGASADSPTKHRSNVRTFEDYRVDYSPSKKTQKSPRKSRSQLPAGKQELPESPKRSRRPLPPRETTHQRPPVVCPDTPLSPEECNSSENASLDESPILTGPSATLSQKVAGSPRKQAPRNRSLKVRNISPSKKEIPEKERPPTSMDQAKITSALEKANGTGSNAREGITDSTVRAKLSSKLELRKRLQTGGRSLSAGRSKSAGRSRSAGRMRENESTDKRPGLSRSNSVSRRKKEAVMGGESNHSSRRQPRRMVQRTNSGTADSVGSSSVEEFDANAFEKRAANLRHTSSRGNPESRLSANSLLEKAGDDRTKSPRRSMRDSRRRSDFEALKHQRQFGDESSRENSSRSSRANPLKQSRGSNPASLDLDDEAFTASFHDCEGESAAEGTPRQSNTNRAKSDLGILGDSFKGNVEENPMQSPSNRPNRIPNRSQSADDVLSSNSLRRSRRPTNRNLTSSRHSTESLGSGSESMISGTENSSESTPSQRGRPSRIRPERRGRETAEEGQQRRSLATAPTRSRSVSVGRSPSRRSAAESLSTRFRGQTPTRSGRETRTDTILGSTSATSPRHKSKTAVGMAHVKQFTKEKARSSSTPRPGRLTDRNNASFCGSLEHLNKLRKPKQAATDDDLVSVDPSVQTWDPSNVSKTRRQNQNSGSNSTHTRRWRKVVKRKIPVSQDGMETSEVSNS